MDGEKDFVREGKGLIQDCLGQATWFPATLSVEMTQNSGDRLTRARITVELVTDFKSVGEIVNRDAIGRGIAQIVGSNTKTLEDRKS